MINFKFIQGRTVRIAIEALALSILFLALAGLMVTWRLMTAPLNIGFAKSYIENALTDKDRGFTVTIEDAALYWPKLQGPLFLGVQGVRLYNKEDRKVISLEEAGISLSKKRLLTGHVSPTSLLITRPNLYVIRSEEGSFDFGFETPETPVITTAADQKQPLQHVLEYIARPGNEPDENDPLAYLRRLEIQDANIVIEDRKLKASWHAPDFDILFTSREDGLHAGLTIGLEEHKTQDFTSGIGVELFYYWDSKTIDATATIVDFDTHLLAEKIPEFSELGNHNITLNGKIQASFDRALDLQHISVALTSDKGEVFLPQVREKPLHYDGLTIEALYDAPQKNLVVPAIRMNLEGVNIAIDSTMTVTRQDSEAMLQGMLSARIPELEHKKLVSLFPQSLEGDDSHEWIVEKIIEGHYSNFSADTLVSLKADETGWHFDLQDMKSRFDFENAHVNYKYHLTPVENGKGAAVFDLKQDTMAIHITEGMINDITVKKGTVFLEEVIAEGTGTVDLDLLLSGPLKSHLQYATDEPIGINEDGAMDIDAVKGDVELSVKMLFPTRDNILLKDMEIDIKGDITNAALPEVAGDIPLTDATLTIAIDNKTATLSGTGKLLDTAVTLTHEEFLKSEGKPYTSRTNADLRLTPALRRDMGIDLSDFIEGAPQTKVVYTKFADAPSEAEVNINLDGTHFFVKPLRYTLPVGTTGQVALKAYIENDTLKEVKDLTVNAPGLTIEPSRLLFRKESGDELVVDRGRISRMIMGETVISIDLEREKTGQMKVVMQGPYFDATPFLDSENEQQEQEGPSEEQTPLLLSISADQMRTARDRTVQYAKLYIDRDVSGAFNQFEVDAIAGNGDIYLRYKADETGKRIFHLEADDAGAALKAFGIYDNIIGGKLVVYGEPRRGFYDRNLIGNAVITNFKIVDAPSLAKLLSILSLPGMLQMMENEGLSFTKLEAGFDWLYHPDGSTLVLKDGRTSGNSLGLTFDGKFDRRNEEVNVSGTIIPLSGVNKIIGNIPLVGDILTGGTGTLFAATYDMKGNLNNPDISVNPLSVLAPGILRRILFE